MRLHAHCRTRSTPHVGNGHSGVPTGRRSHMRCTCVARRTGRSPARTRTVASAHHPPRIGSARIGSPSRTSLTAAHRGNNRRPRMREAAHRARRSHPNRFVRN
nr:hypothetical protein X990_5572 [Burkholderia pseudomallei MSHR4868]